MVKTEYRLYETSPFGFVSFYDPFSQKFGVGDMNGNILLACLYDKVILPDYRGIGYACKHDEWFIYNANGEILNDTPYDEIGLFSPCLQDQNPNFHMCLGVCTELRHANQCGLAKVRRKNKYGYINITGLLVIPLKYDMAWDFGKSGLAKVIFQRDQKYIDIYGEEIISSEGELQHIPNIDIFTVYLNNKYGVMDFKNQIILEMEYDQLLIDTKKKKIFCKKNDQWFVYDLEIRSLSSFPYEDILLLSRSSKTLWVKSQGKWGMINHLGQVILPFVYETAPEVCFNELAVKTTKNNLPVYIDVFGNQFNTLEEMVFFYKNLFEYKPSMTQTTQEKSQTNNYKRQEGGKIW